MSRLNVRLVDDPRPKNGDPERTLRRCVAGLFVLATLALSASGASANDGSADISCTEVTFHFVNFPNVAGNTIHETVTVDGTQVASQTFTFNGPSGSNTIPISVSSGDHFIEVHADWNVDGSANSFDANQKVTCGEPPKCVVPGSIASNFNGTSVVGVGSGPAFIWFNSNLKANGMTSGKSIFLTDSKVFINGVGYDVPNAKITFAPVACATTSYDAGTNTWNTTVPLAGSDEIFLSGLAFPVTNLPGGARVSWQGNFATDQPGACLSWKWGAAAYTYFTTLSTTPVVINYNAALIKPTHTAACLVSNSDHAGTPQNAAIRASVTGGARGGGGSNFTGSWSGTGSLCPACPPLKASSLVATTEQRPVVQETNTALVRELSFAAPVPNPTLVSSTFSFALPRSAAVSLNVYDVSGRLVRELASRDFPSGEHTLSWDLLDGSGHQVSRGIYFVRLVAEDRVLSRVVVIGH